MRTAPIFDTNVFGDVQRGLISKTDWTYLLRHRPRFGWPLSSVTALELLVGVDAARPRDFLHVRERIGLAYDLSRGRILEDPRFLLCNEILRIPVPTDQVPPFSGTVSRYMDVVRRAGFVRTTSQYRRAYKGRKARLDTTAVLTEVMAGPKKAWIGAVERMADETYPAWRDVARRTGKRLPPESGRNSNQDLSGKRNGQPSLGHSWIGWVQTLGRS